MNGTVVIVGATSGIGRALARACAAEGRGVVLAGRDSSSLQRIAADCRVRFAVPARSEHFDALDFEDHAAFVERAAKGFGQGVDGFILCQGEMPDEAVARRDLQVFRRTIDVNYAATVSVLERAADHLSEHPGGFLCAITSVAGDRGRPRNHLYGSTKAAVSVYLGGLRVRMARHGVKVVDVRPGIVDTGLTWALPDLPLRADPAQIARDVLRGIARDRAVVYAPWFWRYVMMIIRWIPDRIFKRLDL
jgi:decaprenylphospho-beta-D-erythro-pentofuranosid-2-ulose 2-reductase